MKYAKPTDKQQLTQEFWDFMKLLCPTAMKVFGEYIDDYKKQNDWDALFNSWSGTDPEIIDVDDLGKDIHLAPKFHDLPTEMQVGVLMKFTKDSQLYRGTHWPIDYGQEHVMMLMLIVETNLKTM